MGHSFLHQYWWIFLIPTGIFAALAAAGAGFAIYYGVDQSVALSCADSCDGVEGHVLPSCLGCDWFLDCDKDPPLKQCEFGELFDVSEGDCGPPDEAVCGLDPQNRTLVPSRSFKKNWAPVSQLLRRNLVGKLFDGKLLG